MKKILLIIWIIIKTICISYAVIFSIAGTSAIVWTYIQIQRPIKAVQKLKTENPKQTFYMRDFQQAHKNASVSDTLLHTFVPLDSISPILIKTVIASEDDGFYIHPGFDIAAIAQAYQYNRERDKLTHGASTITQQVAKNFFAGSEKSFMRKYHELLYTVLMEKILGKERILELYLNYAQWGENIFGCEAASQYYFKKTCKKLTIAEASRLAAVLAKPCKLSPNNMKSIFLGKRMEVIAMNMYRKHMIDDSTYRYLGGPDSFLVSMKLKNGDTLGALNSIGTGKSAETKKPSKKHFF